MRGFPHLGILSLNVCADVLINSDPQWMTENSIRSCIKVQRTHIVPPNGCLYSGSPHTLSCDERKFVGNLRSLLVLLISSRLVILFQRYYQDLRITIMLIPYFSRKVALELVSGVTRVSPVKPLWGWVGVLWENGKIQTRP